MLAAVAVVMVGCGTADADRDARIRALEEERDELSARVEQLTDELADALVQLADAEDEIARLADAAEDDSPGIDDPDPIDDDPGDEPTDLEAPQVDADGPAILMEGISLTAGRVYCVNGFGNGEEVWAQGQVCVVEARAENVGDEPTSLFTSDVEVVDTAGRTHASDDITIDLNFAFDTDRFLSRLNPGQHADGVLVYDIPRGVIPTHLQDRPFRGSPQRVPLPEPTWEGRGDPEWDL